MVKHLLRRETALPACSSTVALPRGGGSGPAGDASQSSDELYLMEDEIDRFLEAFYGAASFHDDIDPGVAGQVGGDDNTPGVVGQINPPIPKEYALVPPDPNLDVVPTAANPARPLYAGQCSYSVLPPTTADDPCSGKMVVNRGDDMLPRIFPSWAPIHQNMDCGRGCSLLREIIHDGDFLATKLQIHGEFGVFHYAILMVTYKMHGVVRCYFSKFHGFQYGFVARFLKEYGEARSKEDLTIISDSITDFSDVLYSGFYEVNIAPPPPAAINSVASSSSNETIASSSDSSQGTSHTVRGPKSIIAAQRERAGKLKLEEISHFFHLPITTASTELRLCTTALKKICRKHGVSRWPHRKVFFQELPSSASKILPILHNACYEVKSTDVMLSRLQLNLRKQSGETARKTLMEMYKLRDERDRACEGWIGQIKRAQNEIAALEDKLKESPRGVEAKRIMAEITELNEKVERCKFKMEKFAKGKKARSRR